MIRPLTAACMLLSCGSGLYLYQVKHRTGMLDRQIEATLEAANAARQRSGVLQAEFTLLNDPERLAGLAARFLPLQTTQPGQFTTMAELDKRLPAVRPPDAPPQSTDEPPDAPPPASPGPEAQPSAQQSPPPAPAPASVARTEPPKPPATAAKPATVTAARPAPDRTREAARSADHPDAARPERQIAEATPHEARSEARSGGSLLGGARVASAPAYTPATIQYAARLAPQPPAVYTPPPSPAGMPGYTQSALGMAHTGSVAPFAGSYNVSNGN